MKTINRLSLQLTADELKTAIEAWVRLEECEIADHLRDNPCSVSMGGPEGAPVIQIDIAGDFIASTEE